MKIIVCGTGNCANYFVKNIEKRDDINIVCFSESIKSKDEWLGIKVIENNELVDIANVDYIVVAALAYQDIRNNLSMYLSATEQKKIIHYVDFLEKIKEKEGPLDSACTTENLTFIFDSKDMIIGPHMKKTARVFADDEIEVFFTLIKKYYKHKENKDTIFFDIGANIGTTSIYVKNKYPQYNIYSIEPSEKTYRILKANCVLNKMEDINCIKCGLSNIEGTSEFHYIPENPGASAIVFDNNKQLEYAKSGVKDSSDEKCVEDVFMKTFSELYQEIGISDDSNIYLWMDTQGFEVKILEGAITVLQRNKLPLFQEYNPFVYKNNNEYEKYIKIISSIYEYFIDCDKDPHGETPIMVNDLGKYTDLMLEEKRESTNLFFI